MLSFSLWGNGKSREFQSTTFKLQLALAKVSVSVMSTGGGGGVLGEQTSGELVVTRSCSCSCSYQAIVPNLLKY